MGAHPKAPSHVGDRTLAEIISDDPCALLGETMARRYGNTLPFLFKLLAADTPLSIQAHPDKKQAEEGFASENAANIPLDAPNRNYKDDNHKPELLCALTEFWALNRFRKIPEILALVDEVASKTIESEVEALRRSPNRDGLRRFFRSTTELPRTRKQTLLSELLTSARRLENRRPEYGWILRIADQYPGDVGVLCVLLLNLVKLESGQAMFCVAGDLHAYLSGFAVELMANSDNVLRGGLTPKHIDRQELMEILTFRDEKVEILEPEAGRYATPADEFELSVMDLDDERVWRSSPGFEILVSVAGDARVSVPGEHEFVALQQGDSVAVPASVPHFLISGPARVYSAGTPRC